MYSLTPSPSDVLLLFVWLVSRKCVYLHVLMQIVFHVDPTIRHQSEL